MQPSHPALLDGKKSWQPFLRVTEVIDWTHPAILATARTLAATPSMGRTAYESTRITAQNCFEWVRDTIRHSVDYQRNPVTCHASEVLQHQTGYCYAKSHLLAALLRANGIAAGFCYQRLRLAEEGSPYSLHGFNAISLPEYGWYRIDARGNRPGVNAQFVPPQEQLAFPVQFPGEVDFATIHADPLPVVLRSLQGARSWDGFLATLPDLEPQNYPAPNGDTDLQVPCLAASEVP